MDKATRAVGVVTDALGDQPSHDDVCDAGIGHAYGKELGDGELELGILLLFSDKSSGGRPQESSISSTY